MNSHLYNLGKVAQSFCESVIFILFYFIYFGHTSQLAGSQFLYQEPKPL